MGIVVDLSMDEGRVRLPEGEAGFAPCCPDDLFWLPAGRRRGVSDAHHPALAVLLAEGLRGGLGGVDEVGWTVAGSPILCCEGGEGTESAPQSLSRNSQPDGAVGSFWGGCQ